MNQRLALGTVQFGMSYGIANDAGHVSSHEALRIVRFARAAGFDTLDTATAYGSSEERLGDIGVREWRVVTKLPPLPDTESDIERWVVDATRASLRRLRVDRLAGLLLHRSADLASRSQTLYTALRRAQDLGLTEKIGISIYDPSELELLDRYPLQLVQAPFNVLDRRLVTSGWLARLRGRNIEVHCRSVFLQGLLLMSPARRPRAFEEYSGVMRRWDEWLQSAGYSALEACLGFVTATRGVDRIIVGVERVAQLEEIVAANRTVVRGVPDDLASTALDLISPNRWSRS